MSRLKRVQTLKRFGIPVIAGLIVSAMAVSLARHGGPMWQAASRLTLAAVGTSILLSVAYRAINACGWGLVLRALGEPISVVAGARIWLASEACRWLPGSVWAFGSRALLGTRRGLDSTRVAASVVLELLITLAAWALIALLGIGRLRMPTGLSMPDHRSVLTLLAIVALAAVAVGVWASRSERLRGRLHGFVLKLEQLRKTDLNWAGLLVVFGFFVLMGLFNGVALLPLVRSIPGGEQCPSLLVIAANAIAWIVGFLALFAPGGLIVREACLAALLSPWMSAEQAIAVALAWRLVQILAEMLGFAVILCTGLPNALRRPA